MKYRLTKEEKQIEKDMENYKSISLGRKKAIERDMKRIARKKVITLRVNETDLLKIKQMAEQEGMPYQTLIGSLLHKFASNRLCEKAPLIR